MTRALSGIGVLVTRPAGQAKSLMRRLNELGAAPLLFPALEILPPRDPAALDAAIAALDACDLAVFVSPTAVERGLAAVGARRAWPARLTAAAVGKGGAAALTRAGVTAILAPEAGADSEHLLALPQLADLTGRRVTLFRGEGGRELLADTLAARGAVVGHAICYRRARPAADPAPVLDAFAAGRLRAVTAFSAETLDHLFALLGKAGAAPLRATPLFAPHPRIAAHARALGIDEAIATPPGEAGLITGLVEYFGHD